jgi:cysteine desulfurase
VIYLDHNATSPMLPEVMTAMTPWFGRPANPSSVHSAGQAAAMAVDKATHHVAALLGRPAAGIVFTSGATEANHQAIRGLATGDVAVAAIEHPSVLAAVDAAGATRHSLAVDAHGRIQLDNVSHCALLCMMAANHETGVVQPLERIGSLNVATHVDATQAVGRVDLSLTAVTSVAISAHKLGGPPGIGALSLLDGEPFPALLGGGSQQRGRRAGTIPTALVVGFGEAARIALLERPQRIARWERLSILLRAGLSGLGARLIGNGHLANTTCVVFDGWPGETIVQALDLRGICVSSGAACASGSIDPSPVLLAMGDTQPDGGVRLSFGAATTVAEVETTLAALSDVLASEL